MEDENKDDLLDKNERHLINMVFELSQQSEAT